MNKGKYTLKRSHIYLRNKLSEREQELLKKDLIDHSIHAISKIKHLSLSSELIESVVKNAVNRVLFTYKFGSGGSLGNLIKAQVMADLRDEYEKAYPDKVSKVVWPDLTEQKPFDRLLEILQKIKLLPKTEIESIFDEANEMLNGRQQKILLTAFTTTSVTYSEICKKFGARGVMTYREIKIIYNQLLQTLKFLEIEL